MTKTIILYGDLRKRFGKQFNFDVSTVAEGVRAMLTVVPGFRAYLQDHLNSAFRVLVDKEAQGAEDLQSPIGRAETIRIVPVTVGASDGVGKILLGVALIAAVYFTGGMAGVGFSMMGTSTLSTMAIGIGMNLALSGVMQLLSNPPNSNQGGTKDMDTWSFNGPTLTTGQGGCVPLGYGIGRISGNVISSGIDSMTWQDKGFDNLAPDNNGTRGGDGGVTTPWVWAKNES